MTTTNPISLRADIMRVMEDKRERTTEDVCHALGTQANPKSVGANLGHMAKAGLMYRDTVQQIAVWRARG